MLQVLSNRRWVCGVVVCSAMFCYVASNRVLRVVELSSFLLVFSIEQSVPCCGVIVVSFSV